jgi:hypothetical protein
VDRERAADEQLLLPAGFLLAPVGEQASVEAVQQWRKRHNSWGPGRAGGDSWWRSDRAGEAPWPCRRRGTGESMRRRGKSERGDPLPHRRGRPPPRCVVTQATGLHACRRPNPEVGESGAGAASAEVSRASVPRAAPVCSPRGGARRRMERSTSACFSRRDDRLALAQGRAPHLRQIEVPSAARRRSATRRHSQHRLLLPLLDPPRLGDEDRPCSIRRPPHRRRGGTG